MLLARLEFRQVRKFVRGSAPLWRGTWECVQVCRCLSDLNFR